MRQAAARRARSIGNRRTDSTSGRPSEPLPVGAASSRMTETLGARSAGRDNPEDARRYLLNESEGTTYELVREVGGGWEGRVWRAWQYSPAGSRLAVAVKVLKPDSYREIGAEPAEVLARWRDQVHVLRNFGHAGFAPVQTVFPVAEPTDGLPGPPEELVGLPAFVMAWVAGPNLREWSRDVPAAVERLEVLEQAAAGLDAFHRETLHVHRDLKPENIVVAAARGRIVDFGLIRSIERVRQGSALLGTEGYVAPELFRGAEYSPTTDLFAFGGVLFHQLVLEAPPPLSSGCGPAWISEVLDRAGFGRAAPVVAGALNARPERRPAVAGAADLLDRVNAAVRGGRRPVPPATTPLPVGPATSGPAADEPSASWVARRAGLVAATAFVLALAAILLLRALTS